MGEREREAGAEIKKAIVCCLLLGIIQSKYLSYRISVPDFTFCDCILRYNFFDEAQKKTILKKV